MEIAADSRQVMTELNANLGKVVGWTDPRDHQDLRRADRASGEDHLTRCGDHLLAATAVEVANSDCALPFQLNALNGRACDHFQVLAIFDRLQIAVGGAPAAPATLSHLHLGNAVLLRAVVVVDEGNSGCLGAGDEVTRQRARRARVLNPQRATNGVVLRCAARVVFGLEEVRLNIVPTPSGAALRFPKVVVERPAADVKHRVHRARSAKPLAAGNEDLAAVAARLGIGGEIPVALAMELLGEDDGDRHGGMAVGAASLEQHDLDGRVLGEAVGQHAAG